MTRPFSLAVAFLILCSVPARADYVNLTGAENARNIAAIRVGNDRVRVAHEVFVEDLDRFFELISGAGRLWNDGDVG